MEKKLDHEEKDVNYKGFIITNVLTGLFIAISIVFLLFLFFSYRDYEYKKGINSPGIDQAVKELREYENRELTTYGFIDREKNIVRIPIENAMQEVIKDYQE